MLKAMNTTELGLILTGLRAIVIRDCEKTRRRLIKEIVAELASRGLAIAQ